ncbi:MAG: class II glutamine amidotransferase [Deltaproteobacteria bacterium]|nr:class II glutamine amidotransferase [Deltaproteobacteria bacterium]
MCRLFGFRSAIYSGVHQSLLKADNALARQSERHTDGWGVAFYVENYPHLIRNDQQAWADSLFREISGVVATRTLLAHIRLATAGTVRVLNCHPFQYGRWTFAHNGELAGFERDEVQREVRDLVDQRFCRYVLGETDSEVLFHIFLSKLAHRVDKLCGEGVQLSVVLDALRLTVQRILEVAPDSGTQPDRHNKLNMLVTNGDLMVGYRYRKELFFSTHKSRCPERESCAVFEESLCERSVDRGRVMHLLIASEPLDGGPNVWQELEDDEYVAVRHGMVFSRGKLGAVD